MTKLYGFGNALIDIEISIKEEDLKSIDIPKGSMKDISYEEMSNLLSDFNSSINSRLPGGSIANALYAANQFGAIIHFSCSVGNDDYGECFVDSFMDNENLITYKMSDKPTGICLIFVTPDGERTMASNLGANEDLSPEALNIEKVKSSDFLIFDNFSLTTTLANSTVVSALNNKNKSTKICFGLSDVNLIDRNIERLEWLSQNKIEYVFGNEKEVERLKEVLEFYAENFVKTLDSRGAMHNDHMMPAPQLSSVANTNGAGDALMGAFLALKEKEGIEKALMKAVAYATRVCSVNGPRLT